MAIEQNNLIESDIEEYLNQHENKELLRFITCGSVDDGKSTLIGRLLHDSKMIFEDQLAAINKDSKKHGTTGEEVDLEGGEEELELQEVLKHLNVDDIIKNLL